MYAWLKENGLSNTHAQGSVRVRSCNYKAVECVFVCVWVFCESVCVWVFVWLSVCIRAASRSLELTPPHAIRDMKRFNGVVPAASIRDNARIEHGLACHGRH